MKTTDSHLEDSNHASSRFDAELPLEHAWSIPKDLYLDPGFAAYEQEQLFRRSWQYVGGAGDISEPGSFVTTKVGREPVLLTRDSTNHLQAFSNICRHRAARVECRSKGQARGFRCRYHGWSYNLRGEIAGQPHCQGMETSPHDEARLPRFHADTSGPFLFTHIDTPEHSLDEFLSPLREMSPEMNLADVQFYDRQEYLLNCNWKLFVDNYLDGGYHIATVHPDLSKVVRDEDYRISCHDHCVLQYSPLKSAKGADHKALNRTRSGKAAYYWWAHPNFMVNAYEGVVDVNYVIPVSADRCRVIFDYYFSPAKQEELGAASIQESLDIAHQVQLEDIEICEEIQSNLGSSSYHSGRFAPSREAGGYLFHRYIWKLYKDYRNLA